MTTKLGDSYPWSALSKDASVAFPARHWAGMVGQEKLTALQTAGLLEEAMGSELIGKFHTLDIGNGPEEHEILFQNGKWLLCSTTTGTTREISLPEIALLRLSRVKITSHLASLNGFTDDTIPFSEKFFSVGKRRIRSQEVRWLACFDESALNDTSATLYLNALAGSKQVVVVSFPQISPGRARNRDLSSRVLLSKIPTEKQAWKIDWLELCSSRFDFQCEEVVPILHEACGKTLIIDTSATAGAVFLFGVDLKIKGGTEAFKYLKEISSFTDGNSISIESFAKDHLRNSRAKFEYAAVVDDAKKQVRSKMRSAFDANDPRLSRALGLMESQSDGLVGLPLRKEEVHIWEKSPTTP